MYKVAQHSLFASFKAAVDAAKALNAEVFEVRQDGSLARRWCPPPPVSKAKMRIYRERKALWAAQSVK